MTYFDREPVAQPAPSAALISVRATPPSGPVRHFADLIAAVEGWQELSATQRRFALIAVRRCAEIIARNTGREHESLAHIACDLDNLNQTLFRRPAAAHHLNPRTFENYAAGLRSALRHVGIMPPELALRAPENPEWQALLERLNCTFAVAGLTRFATWCEERGVRPAAVNDAEIAAFEGHMARCMLNPDIRKKIGNLAKAWRRLVKADLVPNGQRVRAPCRREAYTLPLTAYPPSLQAEIEAFHRLLSHQSGGGPFRQEGPPRSLSAATVKSRLFSLRQALAALVLSGRDPASITSLRELVSEESFELILTHYWQHAIYLKTARGEISGNDDRVSAGVTTQTGAIATTLILVAQYAVKLPTGQLRTLREMARDVRPGMQTEINAKTRRILNELSVPAARMRLLYLPQTLLKEASALHETRPREAARLAMVALGIQIELMVPLRIGNLAALRLDEHLHRMNPKSPMYSLLTLPPLLVKNRVDIQWPIDRDTGAMIALFVRDFRPQLGNASSPWLFPSDYRDVGHARSVDALRAGITNAIAEHVGVQMHVHAFRAFVGMLLLEDSPGALEDLRLVLAHKTLATSQRYYAYIQPKLAAARLSAVLDRARSGQSNPPGSAGERASGVRKPSVWRPQ